MQLYEQIENVPKYKNGSNAIPKDEIVIQYSAFKQSFIQFLEAECERLKEEQKTVVCCDSSECINASKIVSYNQAISDTISHYQNMIKELHGENTNSY